MSRHLPARLALALFDLFAAENEALKGDLIEDVEAGRSQLWLWRQVIGAIMRQPSLQGFQSRVSAQLVVLAAALIMLLSLEAVFVTNLMHRLLFGPTLPDITGYAYLVHRTGAVRVTAPPAQTWAALWLPLAAAGCSAALGWAIAPFHARHRLLSLAVVSAIVMAWASLGLHVTFVVQFLSTLVFIGGLLFGGRLASNQSQPDLV